MANDLFRGYGVEITLPDDEAFLVVCETLTRLGIPSITKTEKKLVQSCHILHKQGRYAIFHFRELYAFDGKATEITEEDIGRRNTIARLLGEWGLLKVSNPEAIKAPIIPVKQIKIIKASEKLDWILQVNYTIGRKKPSISS